MTKLAEIQEAIQRLAPEEQQALLHWLDEMSVVTLKPANRGHFKTSHAEGGLVIGLAGM